MKKTTVKLLSLLLALLVLLLCMTACLEVSVMDEDSDDDDEKQSEDEKADEKSPEEMYVEALNAVNASTNWEVSTTQVIDMTAVVNGQNQTAQQTQSFLQRMHGEDVYVKVWGPSLNSETWYVDGVMYVINGTVKAKATLSLDEYREQYQVSADTNLINIPTDWFENVVLEKADGKTSLHFHVSGEQYAAAIGNMMDSLGSVDDAQIGEVDYTVVFDQKGNIERIISDCSITFVTEGQTVQADYHTVSEVKLDVIESIEAPEDGDSYIDVTGKL